jgi:molecular chaperone GrpE (heat shock protein)
MQDALPPPVPKWPFYLSSAILLATAWFIIWQGTLPPGRWEIIGCLVCIPLGACIAVLPFVLEYQAISHLLEADLLRAGLQQIKHAETIVARIAEATDNWQAVHEQSGKAVVAAREISERMAVEVRGFTEFLEKANDAEKATLRLEVEKMRRGEAEWLQALVRMLDHVYALHTAGMRSGQPRLIEQLTQFQNACRDAARRLGLVPFVAAPDEVFNAQRHQTVDGKAPSAEAKVGETVATGFTFQGRLIRPAAVNIISGVEEAPPAPAQPAEPPEEQTLP